MEGIEYTLKLRVADIWVHDGFRLNPELLVEAVDEKLLGGLTQDGEIEVEIVKEPSEKQIQQSIERHNKTL